MKTTRTGHYEGRGTIRISGLRQYEVDYAFDYDPVSGIHGFVWNDVEYMPTRPTTVILRLENNAQFIPLYLALAGYDRIRKQYQFSLSLSEHQPDNPDNLAAPRGV